MEQENFLVPNHKVLSKDEVKVLLEKYMLNDVFKLPKIKIKDNALKSFEVKIGDVIEITRKSFAGESKYYRVVTE